MSEGKMTLKEFKQILTDAEISTDFESILNYLSGYFYRVSDECYIDNHMELHKKYMSQGNVLYKALEERGYYDDIR